MKTLAPGIENFAKAGERDGLPVNVIPAVHVDCGIDNKIKSTQALMYVSFCIELHASCKQTLKNYTKMSAVVMTTEL